MYKMVAFPSQNAMLRGRLYLPQNAARPLPIVIMAHGFSATIDGMVADRYAQIFYEAGLAVLLYDHLSFGLSDGEPRQHINKWIQTRGYCDAIDFVTTLAEIDSNRIAIWGDSLSGSEVIVVGAIDRRVKAVVAQVPACGHEPPPDDRDGSLFQAIQDTLQSGDFGTAAEDVIGPMPVVSFDQVGTPSLLTPLTAIRWFIEYGAQYGTNWENWAAVITPKTPAPLHPGLCAPHLQAPLLMLIAHHDEMPGAVSSIARMVFDACPQPKELIELDGGHFGLLYYPGELFTQASRAQCEFLLRHL